MTAPRCAGAVAPRRRVEAAAYNLLAESVEGPDRWRHDSAPGLSLSPHEHETVRCPRTPSSTARSAARNCTPRSSAVSAVVRAARSIATAGTRRNTLRRKCRPRTANRAKPGSNRRNRPGDTVPSALSSRCLEQLGVGEELAQGVQLHRLRHVAVEAGLVTAPPVFFLRPAGYRATSSTSSDPGSARRRRATSKPSKQYIAILYVSLTRTYC